MSPVNLSSLFISHELREVCFNEVTNLTGEHTPFTVLKLRTSTRSLTKYETRWLEHRIAFAMTATYVSTLGMFSLVMLFWLA